MRIPSRKKYALKESTDHTNYLASDGMIVPSVTTVLEIINKRELLYWANSLGYKHISVQKELARTADIGTISHCYAESVMQGKYMSSIAFTDILDNLEEDKLPYVKNAMKSFDLWYAKNSDRIKLLNTELPMTSDSYGGTCDIICKFDGKLIIIDLKTSGDFHSTQFIQLSAYAKLYHKIYKDEIEDVAVLRLDKIHGKEAKIKFLSEIPGGSIEYYYEAFKAAKALYHFMHVIDTDFDSKNDEG